MRKLIMVIVCLMTMAFLTSCSEKNVFDKFNLVDNGLNKEGTGWQMVEESLQSLEQYYYLYGKYDLECVSFLKTKIYIQTDSLILGESYIRGKNSFDGGTMQNRLFIYLKNINGTYFDLVDSEDFVKLIMRMNLEDEYKNKTKILSKYVVKHGYLNNETDFEHCVRYDKGAKNNVKNIKYYKKFLDEDLGFN